MVEPHDKYFQGKIQSQITSGFPVGDPNSLVPKFVNGYNKYFKTHTKESGLSRSKSGTFSVQFLRIRY